MARGVALPVAGGLATVDFFALFHGVAHGLEAPASGILSGYMAGFAVSTGLLLAAGAIIGRAAPLPTVRLAGATVAVGGVAWRVWLLIGAFQIGAAVVAAVDIATVDDMLPDDDDFARAVAKPRIACEAETLLSPLLAAALLAVVTPRDTFLVCALLLGLAMLAMRGARLPAGQQATGGPLRRLRGGLRPLFADRALRAALVVSAAGIAVSAMIVVNTVALVRNVFDLNGVFVGLALAAYGAGGMATALTMPALLRRVSEVALMTRSAAAVAVLLLLGPAAASFPALLALWATIGVGSTLAQLPVKLMEGGRQAMHAAHYALEHAILLVVYPVAGWVGAIAGLEYSFLGLAVIAGLPVLASALISPRASTADRVLEDRASSGVRPGTSHQPAPVATKPWPFPSPPADGGWALAHHFVREPRSPRTSRQLIDQRPGRDGGHLPRARPEAKHLAVSQTLPLSRAVSIDS